VLSLLLFNDVDDSGKLGDLLQRLLKLEAIMEDFLISMTDVYGEEAHSLEEIDEEKDNVR
jgi:hypothetical protein